MGFIFRTEPLGSLLKFAVRFENNGRNMVRDLGGYGDESVNGCDFVPSNHGLQPAILILFAFRSSFP